MIRRMIRSVLVALMLCSGASASPPQQEIAEKIPGAVKILETYHSSSPAPVDKKLHIVYWSPADREPQAGYRGRLSAIMEDIRSFYAGEMARLGFGPMSFRLDHEEDGKLAIHLAKGGKPRASYDRASGDEIRKDCLPVLESAGLDPEKETFLIFCNLSDWDPGARTIRQNSPYYASGTNIRGTGWQVDSAILDLTGLPERELRVKDGQYGDISVGKYNSIFIGGIAHELGHALGLPHNCARPDEASAFGTALMGAGNRTYGDQLRGEGRGSFLTLAHGLKLASHPIFSGSARGLEIAANAEPGSLQLRNHGKYFTCSGVVRADPPVHAVLGYMDPEGGGDYDATTCTAVPDENGRFVLTADAFAPGRAGVFRLVFLQANGAATSFASPGPRFAFPYSVAEDGMLDTSAAEAVIMLRPLMDEISAGDPDGTAAQLRAILAAKPAPLVEETAVVLAATVSKGGRRSPELAEGRLCHLSDAEALSSSVGYGRSLPNRLPEGLFICGGRLYPRGLYAHAPSSYRWNLGGRWKLFSGTAGLPDGRDGSCDFRIMGDGREIWRTGKTTAGQPRPFQVSVEGVKELELVAGDAGDGRSSDWACWLAPTLSR